jgi:hypothetical protein
MRLTFFKRFLNIPAESVIREVRFTGYRTELNAGGSVTERAVGRCAGEALSMAVNPPTSRGIYGNEIPARIEFSATGADCVSLIT